MNDFDDGTCWPANRAVGEIAETVAKAEAVRFRPFVSERAWSYALTTSLISALLRARRLLETLHDTEPKCQIANMHFSIPFSTLLAVVSALNTRDGLEPRAKLRAPLRFSRHQRQAVALTPE